MIDRPSPIAAAAAAMLSEKRDVRDRSADSKLACQLNVTSSVGVTVETDNLNLQLNERPACSQSFRMMRTYFLLRAKVSSMAL